MLWSDRVAGTRWRQAAQKVSGHGGPGLPDPVGPDPGTAAAAAAVPRVETRPEGWRLVDRRGLLKAAGMAAVAAPATGLLAACGGGSSGGGERRVRIGLVSPRTGALRNFSEVDNQVVATMNSHFADGMKVGSNTFPVEIFIRDGQSDRNRAAAAATDLIFTDKVDIVLVGGTADNANPVSDICEAQGVPCISTAVPWEAWFYGRGGTPQKPFSWTYHVYWGMTELRGLYRTMWQTLDVPRSVALILPTDQEGDAYANPTYGLPKLADDGFQILSAGSLFRYAPGSASIGELARAVIENEISIVAGAPSITDLSAFWRVLNGESYRPHIASLSKALLFADDVDGLGSAANGFTTEVGWSPKFPYRSSLTERTSEEIANEEENNWSQPLGFTHALFEIVTQALAGVDSLDDRRSIADAISRVQAQTLVGPVTFGDPNKQLPKNVASVPLAGGRWTRESTRPTLRIANPNGLNLAAEIEMVDLESLSTG